MTDSSHLLQIGRARIVTTIVVCAGIIIVSAATIWIIDNTEPTAERSATTRKSAALVDTITVARGDYRPEIAVLGTVQASRDISLRPRVSGEVVEVSTAFEPGGFVEAGELLVRIDSADYANALAMRRSALHEAEAELAIEEGRRTVAEKEFALLNETIDPENRSLVLREPQIASARARVESARAQVEQAELDLSRTEVRAPFSAQVIDRHVNLGSQVSPGEVLARLVGTDEYWVEASVPLRSLQWLTFPQGESQGARVHLRNRGAWDPDVTRIGRLTRLIGTVDEQTRLARVLIAVPDPLGHKSDGPALLLGSVLEARIEGRLIPDAVRLERDFVRANDTLWVFDDGKLSIRQAGIVFRGAKYAYIREGLASGDRIVTTPLATVAEGIPLRDSSEVQPEAVSARE